MSGLHDDYPGNALASIVDGQVLGCPPVLCGRLSPDGSMACTRPFGHEGGHNREQDGSGVGW